MTRFHVDLLSGLIFEKMNIETNNKGLLLVDGFHVMAAGFIVMEDQIVELQNFLNILFVKDFQNSNLFVIYEYEGELIYNSFTIKLLE